jgi:histidinol-phosphate aminotransferase
MLVRVTDPDGVCAQLLKSGVIVRSMASFSLDGMIRVSIGLASENERFLQSLSSLVPSSSS